MRFAHATLISLVFWLTATSYWIYAHSVNSHTTWECLTNSCFKITHKNVITPKEWYNNLNVHTIHKCSIRNKGFMVVTVDVCDFSYICFKCLGDVWNVRVVTNYNLYKSTYNKFVNANMKMHMK